MGKKNVIILMSQACGMGGELGSKMIGFAEETAFMSHDYNHVWKQGCVELYTRNQLH